MPVLTKINTNVIADDAVTSAKIPADALGATDIAANAIGTSEIATGGVLPANIAYLGDGTGNLSGTITNQQLHFGSAFTLTGDLTVNDDLVLGKVRDDGTGQSITGDGKTLTGTGTLTMGGSVEGVPQTRDVDGKRITGTLGSAVTLADGFTLGSGVTFPAGHVVQVVSGNDSTTLYSTTQLAEITCTNWYGTITKIHSASKIVVFYQGAVMAYQNNYNGLVKTQIRFNRSLPTSAYFGDAHYEAGNAAGNGSNYNNSKGVVSGIFHDTSSATGEHKYTALLAGGAPSQGNPEAVVHSDGISTMTLFEVMT
mgnify:CR=1 FL=1